MGIGNRAATCASCSKRLTRKHWYYRNGKYYCKQRCWTTEQAKAAKEAAEQAAKAEPAAATAAADTGKPAEPPAPAKPDDAKAAA